MKRFLALFSAVAFCLCSISCAYAAEVNGSIPAAQVQEESTEWFCEEHQQPLIPEEDVLPGTHQVCLLCHPEYIFSITPMASEVDAQYIMPVSMALGSTTSPSSLPSQWNNMSTLVDDTTGMTMYYFRSISRDTCYLRLVFSSQIQPSGNYLWFYYTFDSYPDHYDWQFANNGSSASSFVDFSDTSRTVSSVLNLDYVFSGRLSSALLSSNTYYLRISDFDQFGGGYIYFSGVYISDEGYTGTGGGGTGGGGGTDPEEPGFDDEDGWLGKLIDSIIAGINEIIEGIGSIGGQISSAVSNIGNQISNAVNSIGTAITGAVDAASSAISSAVDSASSAITGIIGQQWNDQSGHNDEIDQAVSDLENQDQQMGQVEDQYLDDFHDQQSSMAGTVSTFQWPSGITSAMAWITIQMNSIWSGLGGNVQMLFTFSMILGLSLIFLGRWRA